MPPGDGPHLQELTAGASRSHPLHPAPGAYVRLRLDRTRGEVAVRLFDGGDAPLWEGETLFRVRGPLAPPERTFAVEPDASSAAVALAAACLSGGELAIEGLGTRALQGDARIRAGVPALCPS